MRRQILVDDYCGLFFSPQFFCSACQRWPETSEKA